jgi:hypothetical protein
MAIFTVDLVLSQFQPARFLAPYFLHPELYVNNTLKCQCMTKLQFKRSVTNAAWGRNRCSFLET